MYFLYHLIKHSQVSLKLKIKLFQLALPLEAVVWTGIIRFSDAFSDIFDLRCMFVPLKSFIFSSQMHHRPPTGRLTKYVRREEVISYANCWVYDIKHPFNSSPNLLHCVNKYRHWRHILCSHTFKYNLSHCLLPTKIHSRVCLRATFLLFCCIEDIPERHAVSHQTNLWIRIQNYCTYCMFTSSNWQILLSTPLIKWLCCLDEWLMVTFLCRVCCKQYNVIDNNMADDGSAPNITTEIVETKRSWAHFMEKPFFWSRSPVPAHLRYSPLWPTFKYINNKLHSNKQQWSCFIIQTISL